MSRPSANEVRAPRLAWLAPAFAAASVAAWAAVTWGYAVDDAWIVARYAQRIASGQGYTFVPGPPTDGVTGPLWLLPMIVGARWAAPVFAAKLVGVSAAAGAAALATRWAGEGGQRHAWVVALFLAASPLLGIWAAAGLETGLAALAFTTLAWGAASGRGAAVGLATATLAWLRPEAAPAALVALALLSRAGRRELAWAWGLALLGAGSVLAFRLAMFGSPLPLSASAKPPELALGASYVARGAILVFGGLVAVGLGATDPPRRPVVWILIAHLLAVILAGGDWMPGFRLLVVALPAAAWVAAGWIGPRLLRPTGALTLAASLAIPLLAGGLAAMDARDAARSRDTAGRQLSEWLAAHASRVALVDVGYLVYASGVEPVDLGGVTDPAVARRPGGHAAKRIDPSALAARAPDTLVLHSTVEPRVDAEGRLIGLAGHPVERRVAEMAWVRRRARVVRVVPYAPAYWYVVLRVSPARADGGNLEP